MKGEHGPGESFDLGMICSFSIPIITICALIVLMIIVEPAEHRLLVDAVLPASASRCRVQGEGGR